MSEAVLDQPVATTTPEPVAPVVEPPHVLPGTEPKNGPDDDDGPIDDVVDDDGHQPRHRGSRAKSKMAAARINRLTGENKQLQERLAALEAKQQAPRREEPVVRQVPPAPKVEFSEPVPKIEDFGHEEDPYGAWLEAKIEHKQRKAQAEREGQQAQGQHQRQFEDTQRYYQQVESTHKQRLMEAAKNPANLKALQSVTVAPPPLLDWAIMLDNQSADVALFLATNPAVLDEFVLYTEAKPVNEQTVAITRRLLRQRMSAGTTGSVAPSKALPTTPKPPNPVRSAGSIRTGAEPPPEGVSIADHAKFYSPKR